MQIISTPSAPQAIGPYSQGIVTGDLVFTAGQIALDPATMEMVGSDVAEQAQQVMLNLKAVLKAAGTDLDNVVKTTVYLADMAHFPAMNDVYAKHFGDHKPARATVEAGGLPKGALVEIDAIAVVG
jgi:2-iminobutanoate/2-iminopropanoate deaminase